MLFKFQVWTILWFTTALQVTAQQFHTEPGQQFITFEQTDIDGNHRSTHSLKGKPSLIIFFGTRCPPCMMELKELSETLPSSWHSKVNLIAIGSTDDRESLIKFKTRTGYPFTFIPDQNQFLFNQIGDYVIPRTFLLDQDGVILSQKVGYNLYHVDELMAEIDGLVNN